MVICSSYGQKSNSISNLKHKWMNMSSYVIIIIEIDSFLMEKIKCIWIILIRFTSSRTHHKNMRKIYLYLKTMNYFSSRVYIYIFIKNYYKFADSCRRNYIVITRGVDPGRSVGRIAIKSIPQERWKITYENQFLIFGICQFINLLKISLNMDF